MEFRQDINGLRAVAVIAVLLYHFNIPPFIGGFSGVDMFFVISGYLMTAIILNKIAYNQFSFSVFYGARIKRIIPLLLVVCVFTTLIGIILFSPNELMMYSKHALSSLLFHSNITYWLESGYFDASSEQKWLLHTWSLSVEWQFYLLYPIALVFIRKLVKVELLTWILITAIVAFYMLSIYTSWRWPDAAYFLLPSRVWEMLLGGAAYLLSDKVREKLKAPYFYLGLFLVLSSPFVFNATNYWPGYASLYPCLGIFFIIIANKGHWIFTNILSHKIGLWSYSLYLWHWPIYLLFKRIYGEDFNAFYCLAITFLISVASYKFIEQRKYTVKSVIAGLIISVCIFLGLIYTDGLVQRFSPKSIAKVKIMSQSIKMPTIDNGYCFYSFDDIPNLKISDTNFKNCSLGSQTNKEPKVLLFGDSFAGQYEPFLDVIFSLHKINLHSVTTNWCFPALTNSYTGKESHPAFKQCLLQRDFLKQAITMKKYEKIILAANWDDVANQGYIEDVKQLITFAKENEINVLIMPSPMKFRENIVQFFKKSIYMQQVQNFETICEPLKISNITSSIEKLFGEIEHVTLLSKNKVFDEKCLINSELGKIPYTLDGKHLSIIGSINLAKKLMENEENSDTLNNFIKR